MEVGEKKQKVKGKRKVEERKDWLTFSLIAHPTSESLPLELDPRADVSRLDLRVGRILSGRHHPLANTMSVLEVDMGENSPRTVVSKLGKITQLEEVTQIYSHNIT